MDIGHEIDLQFGEGLHRLAISFHSMTWWVVQVPFLGKAWSYGHDGRGCTSWAALRARDALRRLERPERERPLSEPTAKQDRPVAA